MFEKEEHKKITVLYSKFTFVFLFFFNLSDEKNM